MEKKWKERQLAAKEKWKIRVDGSEMKKRLRGNTVCEIRGNGQELFLDQCDAKRTNEYERDEWKE